MPGSARKTLRGRARKRPQAEARTRWSKQHLGTTASVTVTTSSTWRRTSSRAEEVRFVVSCGRGPFQR